jgi:hypothetical protein
VLFSYSECNIKELFLTKLLAIHLAKPSMILVSRPAGGTPALPARSGIFFCKGAGFGDPTYINALIDIKIQQE